MYCASYLAYAQITTVQTALFLLFNIKYYTPLPSHSYYRAKPAQKKKETRGEAGRANNEHWMENYKACTTRDASFGNFINYTSNASTPMGYRDQHVSFNLNKMRKFSNSVFFLQCSSDDEMRVYLYLWWSVEKDNKSWDLRNIFHKMHVCTGLLVRWKITNVKMIYEVTWNCSAAKFLALLLCCS